MRVKEILTDYKLCVIDLEVHLNGDKRNALSLSLRLRWGGNYSPEHC